MQLYLRVCAPRTKRCSYLRAARAVALVREAWVQLRPLPGYQICAPGTARRVSKKGQGGHGLRNCAGSANDLEMQAWERGSCDRVRRCGQRLAARRPSARILQSGRQCGRGPRACARTEAAAGVLCGRTRHSLRENTQTGRAAVRAAGGRICWRLSWPADCQPGFNFTLQNGRGSMNAGPFSRLKMCL